MPTIWPLSNLTPRSRAASSITIPSCWALSQPARRACDPLDEVDAAVHERGHRPIGAGPPVAIGFGRFVRGERERVALLDDRHVVVAVLDREIIGGRDPGDARAADDYSR